MEKYMFLFRGGGEGPTNTNEVIDPMDRMKEWINWMEDLGQKGLLVGGEPLKSNGKQVIGREKTITDGPFIESKEMVGGYLIVKANNIDHAVEISMGCPIFNENGKVEVREIQPM